MKMINKSWLSRQFDIQHCTGNLKSKKHKKWTFNKKENHNLPFIGK